MAWVGIDVLASVRVGIALGIKFALPKEIGERIR